MASLTMLSLLSKNKNKKKHFRSSFGDCPPKKIVFDAPAAGSLLSISSISSSSSPSSAAPSPTSSKPTATPQTQTHTANPSHPSTPARPRLIPPSERQDLGTLPAGMFVTSVDVEEGMTRKRKKKNLDVQRQVYQGQDRNELEAEEGWLDPESFYADSQPASMGSQINGSQYKVKEADSDPYVKAEGAWSSCRKIEQWEDLSVGCVVGWWVSVVVFCYFAVGMILFFNCPVFRLSALSLVSLIPSCAGIVFILECTLTTTTGSSNQSNNIHPRKSPHTRASCLPFSTRR